MKDPAFLFYPGDYLRDTQCLSEKTQVAYDRIMCEHMRNICISQKQLNFFTKRLSEDEKEELKMILKKINSGYQIEWVAESIEKRRTYSESRRKNRTGKKRNISKTYDPHMENESENVNEIIIEIVKHLNQKTKNNYSYHSRNIQQLIMDRMEEKFTLKDFIKVIDNKCVEWLNTENAKWLRPETLFSVEHFDSYLQDKSSTTEILDMDTN
ncbi:MAG: conserved phage C-terminal domain-containing protein [Bacteroidetes bacterium]|nr:conserved phage C-terminal domain-containing protein [Bacteroidota bacterium]